MEGLNLDVLGTEEVERLFSDNGVSGESQEPAKENAGTEEETAEVDFSDLGIEPESVGSGESEEKGEAPASKTAGTRNQNLFFSIAKALRDEGVFPDLDEDSLSEIKDASDFRKLFEDQVSSSLNERARRLEQALGGGATTDEMREYDNTMNIAGQLFSDQMAKSVEEESDQGENLRRMLMTSDYTNRGFSEERAKKLVEKSFADGTDIEDAKEALNSLRDLYAKRLEDYKRVFGEREEAIKKQQQEDYDNFKKMMLDQEEFAGMKIDRKTRQKAYDAVMAKRHRTQDGNIVSDLQKYQMEHPKEWIRNMAMVYTLTDGFKSFDKVIKPGVKAGLKKGFDELESVLNSTKRTPDGLLDLANSMPEENGRENWTLAI